MMSGKGLKRRSTLIVLCAVFLLGLASDLVIAHPLGNFTINHFARVTVNARTVSVRYVVDMAEISTLQELQSAGVADSAAPTSAELSSYLDRMAVEYPSGIALLIDNKRISLSCSSKAISMPDGAGGLKTLRTEFDFEGELPYSSVGAARTLRFADNNHRERIGWHELVVAAAPGISIYNSSAYGSAVTDELKAYPQNAIAAPLNERECNLAFTSGLVPAGSKALQSRDGAKVAPTRDRLAELIAVPRITPAIAILGLLIAAVLGSLHAMSPGHGKTIVGAYLVGSRGTARHAAFLGLTVTVTHTAGVFALGLITLLASRYVVPERLYPFLSFISGFMVVAIGLRLLTQRLRVILAARNANHSKPHWTSEIELATAHHSHSHNESGEHEHVHSSEDYHRHSHHAHSDHAHHTHDHDDAHAHDHSHSDGDHSHHHRHDDNAQVHHAHSDHHHPDHDHNHRAEEDLLKPHSHGGFTHSHLPPGADGNPVGWRSLLALGISGGLLPCPSALIVLLAAISLHRVGYGLALVLSFSAGLAASLTSVGLVFVYAGRFLKRWVQSGRFAKSDRTNKLNYLGNVVRILPALSASVVMAAGGAICVEALNQAGLSAASLAIQLGAAGRIVAFAAAGTVAMLLLRLAYRFRRA